MARVELALQIFAPDGRTLNVEISAGNTDEENPTDDPTFVLTLCEKDPPRSGEEHHGAGYYACLEAGAAEALANFVHTVIAICRRD